LGRKILPAGLAATFRDTSPDSNPAGSVHEGDRHGCPQSVDFILDLCGGASGYAATR